MNNHQIKTKQDGVEYLNLNFSKKWSSVFYYDRLETLGIKLMENKMHGLRNLNDIKNVKRN